MQEVRDTIALLSTDRGAVIKAAEKRVNKAKVALSKAQELHAGNVEKMNLKKAELECAAEDRRNMQQQVDVVTADLEAAQARILKVLFVGWICVIMLMIHTYRYPRVTVAWERW